MTEPDAMNSIPFAIAWLNRWNIEAPKAMTAAWWWSLLNNHRETPSPVKMYANWLIVE